MPPLSARQPATTTPPASAAALHLAVPRRRSAIAPVLERLQSELLVGGWLVMVLPLALLMLWVQTVLAWQTGRLLTGMRMQGVYISVLLACLVMALRAATPAAAAVGAAICFIMTLGTTLTSNPLSETALPALLAVFILTYAATRLGHARKAALGLAEKRHGRAASQIVANLGIASAVALLRGLTSAAAVACIAVLAEATADTVSSELGPLFHGRTVLLTTLRPVAPGTDGGISLGGSLCGIAGAVIVITVGITTMHLSALEGWIAFFSAVAGFSTDSLLGATLERRGQIGNDLVNFLSTAATAAVALPLGILLLP